jgi:hypothetical protein
MQTVEKTWGEKKDTIAQKELFLLNRWLKLEKES